jgi:Predicted phosphoesterase or phosphohydrolase
MSEKQIWFTSDLHIDHANIIKFCNRPWTFEQQREEIITRWNSRVGLMDDVYHLGDFMFTGSKGLQKALDIIKELNGNITFIRGNHDQDGLWDLIEHSNLAHVKEVCHYKEITIERNKVCLFHFPLETWNKAHHGAWHLHGHSHGSMKPRGKRLDVGIDNHPDHQVFSLAEIKIHMAKQEFQIVDHHTGERE